MKKKVPAMPGAVFHGIAGENKPSVTAEYAKRAVNNLFHHMGINRVEKFKQQRQKGETLQQYHNRLKREQDEVKQIMRGQVIYVSMKGGKPYVKKEFGPIGRRHGSE